MFFTDDIFNDVIGGRLESNLFILGNLIAGIGMKSGGLVAQSNIGASPQAEKSDEQDANDDEVFFLH